MKKKRFFHIAILNVLMVLMFVSLVNDASSAYGAGDLTAGEKLYKRKCSVCHGADGQGGMGVKIKDPGVLKKTDEEFRKVITDGANGMPGYGKTLKPEEIDSLVVFLRSWAK